MANEIVVKEKDISDSVLSRVRALENTGDIKLPQNYSAENALKSAWLMLQETKNAQGQFALAHCTKPSIANSLFDMVIQGLSPVKKQCYFIMYGDKLQMSRSYMGSIAVSKRVGGVADVKANVIYDKDEFEFEIDAETGLKKIIKHAQALANFGGNIVGAYAILTLSDSSRYIEIMNMEQIKASWNRGQAKGNSMAHKDHPEEMAKKTVISRACKLFINTSDDAALFEGDEFDGVDYNKKAIGEEIQQNANTGEEIGFSDAIEGTYTEVSSESEGLQPGEVSTDQENLEEVVGF